LQPQRDKAQRRPTLCLKELMMANISFARGLLFGAAALGALAGSTLSASAEEVLNIYTTREPGLIKPVLD